MIAASPIRLVSFDLDLTLVDASLCVTPAVRSAFRIARDLGDAGRPVIDAITTFIATGDPLQRPDRIAAMPRNAQLLEALRSAFADNDGIVEVTPGAATVMDHIAAQARIVVITNGYPELQAAKLRRADLDRFVFALVASEGIGLRKPDRGIFDHAAQLAGVEAAAAMHIGDSLEDDVVGAEAAGFGALLFRPANLDAPKPPARVRCIEALSEIPSILRL